MPTEKDFVKPHLAMAERILDSVGLPSLNLRMREKSNTLAAMSISSSRKKTAGIPSCLLGDAGDSGRVGSRAAGGMESCLSAEAKETFGCVLDSKGGCTDSVSAALCGG